MPAPLNQINCCTSGVTTIPQFRLPQKGTLANCDQSPKDKMVRSGSQRKRQAHNPHAQLVSAIDYRYQT